MGRQTKSFKRYKKDKGLQTAKIKAQVGKKKENEQKRAVEKRLLETEFSDSDNEQMQDDQRKCR
jgi:hypothetical protein